MSAAKISTTIAHAVAAGLSGCLWCSDLIVRLWELTSSKCASTTTRSFWGSIAASCSHTSFPYADGEHEAALGPVIMAGEAYGKVRLEISSSFPEAMMANGSEICGTVTGSI
jgi:hypothetical protein